MRPADDMPTDPEDVPRGSFPTGATVSGEVRVPRSKSIAQRALAAALVARGTTEIQGLPGSDDVLHALRCARAAGARFPSRGKPDDLLATALLSRRGFGELVGVPPQADEGARPWCEMPVGESGTSARLFTALAALGRPPGSGAELTPKGTLGARRSPALFAALREAGAGVEHGRQEDGWPTLITAVAPPADLRLVDPTSSQEVSALLMALAAHPGEHRLRVEGAIPSRGYVEITRGVLEQFRASVRSYADASGGSEVFTVRGPMIAPSSPLEVEADASAAAVVLAASAVSGGQPVWVPGVGTGSAQPDALMLEHLEAFGCDVSGSDASRLHTSGEPQRSAAVDCSRTPDAAPPLAIVAAWAAHRGLGESVLTGLGTLPGKESSRIVVLAEGLEAAGFLVQHDERSLRVAAPKTGLPVHSGLLLDPHSDHRMAFAFGLLGLFLPGLSVLDPACVRKSWPGFWGDLLPGAQ